MCGRDVPLLIEVASAPVLNGCVQRGHRLLGGLCPEQWPPTAHHKSAVQPSTGRKTPVHTTDFLFCFYVLTIVLGFTEYMMRIADTCNSTRMTIILETKKCTF